MNGRLITIEGLDGSGKGTQTGLLFDALARQSLPVKKVSFPRYTSDASAPVRMYLAGDFGKKPGDVNAYAASAFFAVDRFAAWRQDIQPFYQAGGIVLADRYTTSNAIHQCSKLPESQWDEFLAWLFDLEYTRMGLPAPDLVFYLDMDPAVSQKLMTGRYQGDEGKKDIHEKDLEYLARSRAAARYCADKLGWQRIACDNGTDPLPLQTIHRQILARVQALLG